VHAVEEIPHKHTSLTILYNGLYDYLLVETVLINPCGYCERFGLVKSGSLILVTS